MTTTSSELVSSSPTTPTHQYTQRGFCGDLYGYRPGAGTHRVRGDDLRPRRIGFAGGIFYCGIPSSSDAEVALSSIRYWYYTEAERSEDHRLAEGYPR